MNKSSALKIDPAQVGICYSTRHKKTDNQPIMDSFIKNETKWKKKT